MLRASIRLAAIALVLGFLVGDSLADREPEVVASPAQRASTPSSTEVATRSIPYANSPQPAHLGIPALDVTANIRPVGNSDATTMQVPSDIRVVGWYDRSALPISTAGNTVLVGHRDGAVDPNGIFRNLGSVREGDRVQVSDIAGRTIDYIVDGVTVLSDEQFAQRAERIFRRDGRHRLVLITCGGNYDAARGGYQANVVVTAKRT